MIGKSIGRYKIVEKLGEGGMGTVWKAEDSTLGRMVALKFLSTDIPNDDERARFLREARAASALDHPGICTIYEADEDEDGNPYLAMAYCEGDSLRDRIAKGPLPLDEALSVTIQIGRQNCCRSIGNIIINRRLKYPAAIIYQYRHAILNIIGHSQIGNLIAIKISHCDGIWRRPGVIRRIH